MRVRNATVDPICDDNERSVVDCREKSLDPLRHIVGNTNEDSVTIKMFHSTNVVTFMLAYIDSAFVHTRYYSGMHLMSSEGFSLKTRAFDPEYVFVEKTLQTRLHHRSS